MLGVLRSCKQPPAVGPHSDGGVDPPSDPIAATASARVSNAVTSMDLAVWHTLRTVLTSGHLALGATVVHAPSALTRPRQRWSLIQSCRSRFAAGSVSIEPPGSYRLIELKLQFNPDRGLSLF